MNKESNIFKNIITVLLALLVFGMAAGPADADFSFRGYTYNETNVALNNTNVSIEVYQFSGGPPTLVGTVYNSSNTTGFFNISITTALDQPQYMYKPVLKHFANNATSGTLDGIGQTLPQFPRDMISFLTVSSPMNFYLRKGGTININATNETGFNIAFKYVIKDTRLGYPITENFTTEQGNVTNLHVPLERNYSIMIFPNQSLPISYDLNNLSTYTNNTVNITFNTSIIPRWVSGYANLSGGSSNFTNLAIIAYLMEPGNIIGKDRPMPYNMSAFRGDGSSDTYNATNGSYNITLPGSAQGTGANILLFATAKNGSNYYGAFKNITMNYSNFNEQNFNFTLWELLGNVENISVNNMGIQGINTQNITTKQLPFQLLNGTQNLTNQFAHIEIEVNYSANSSAAFKWMVSVSQTANGTFSIPAINANIRKINVFTQNFAPLKTSKNTTQLATQPVNITLTSFSNKKPDGTQLSGVFIDMLLSKPECDRPVPASGCSLAPDPTNGTAEGSFEPFKIVLGGGKISLRIKQTSTRITVHYKNVDMLASGPPDALFDESANQSQNGSALEQAWRFGSKGPEIYDEVLIGVPISGVSVSKVYLGKLYDENWNATWNISAGDTLANLSSDYSTFNTSWFNSTTGMPCSNTDNSSSCYIDTATGVLWLRIPHFSGVGPTVSGSSGNVTVNLTNSTGTAGSSAIMNFTIRDNTNTTSWYNITFPSGFNAGGAIANITINGSTDPVDWQKIVTPSYVNVTSTSAATATLDTNQYINLSNVTLPSTTGNHTINITTSRGVTVSLNYTVVNYSVSLSVDSAAKSTNTTVNATYTLTLLNNGTSASTYNLTVTNTDLASTASLNISTNITLAASASQTILLNVTNTAGGTYRVNVTAVSLNDTTKFSYINTTTTATNYSVRLSVDSAAKSTNATVNATYTLTLLNNGTNASTYNFTVTNTDLASTAALNISGNVTLAASSSQIILLNVTNTAGGTYRVNVTAVSLNDTSKFSYINTTTTVEIHSVSLSVDSAAKTTNAAQNATYTLTLLNNGTNTGTYNLTVTNTDSASTAALNISENVTLAANTNRTILLNVTNTSSGVFRVNVTAVSLNDTTKFSYINTTTT
ncbi:MAG: hypothetical protein Q7U60_01825, partial [Candidatus Methanoperedens sp.]|nr:hypothetical protein [Candidatus Methanoperedens sp.]